MKPYFHAPSTKKNSKSAKCIFTGILFFASLPILAIAQTKTPMEMPVGSASAQSASMPNSSSMNSKGMDMKQSMDGMHQKMLSMPMTGDTDRNFAMMMREHHQGAIDMAEMELKQGKDPQLHKMAMKIIAAQKTEMAAFDTWLKKHDASKSTGQVEK